MAAAARRRGGTHAVVALMRAAAIAMDVGASLASTGGGTR